MPYWPEFTIATWAHFANPPKDDGLWDNGCWPKDLAVDDPGFALLAIDPWYQDNVRPFYKKDTNGKVINAPKWDYAKGYEKGKNGD